MVVELKNDLSVEGTLKSVDQFLNIKLDNIQVLDEEKHPHMVSWEISAALLSGTTTRRARRLCVQSDLGADLHHRYTRLLSEIASSVGPWCAMSSYRKLLSTLSCWRMRREGVSSNLLLGWRTARDPLR